MPSRTASDLQVLFRDDLLIGLDKPSGLLVHRGWGRDEVVLVDLVRALTGLESAAPVHRLDRGTSGVLLLALDPGAACALSGQFERGEVEKTYLALVRGLAPAEGEIDHPIPRREGGPRVPARSSFRRLASAETTPRSVSLVEVRPHTGRLHQVRRHLKHLGHPVIGDANYGKGPLNRAIADLYGLRRLALHAASLALTHPRTGERLELAAPLPPDLLKPFARMGLRSEELGGGE